MNRFLLICLIVIIIVVVIAIGTRIYKKNLVENNRKAVIADLKQISTQAIAYYDAPLQIGGGDNSWVPKILMD